MYDLLFLFCLLMIQTYCHPKVDSETFFSFWGGQTGWIGQKIVTFFLERNFKVYLDPKFSNSNFALKEQGMFLKERRSFYELA